MFQVDKLKLVECMIKVLMLSLLQQVELETVLLLRQNNALKLEMKKAVHQENFERAAELRDQIRSLEAAHKEQKENK